MSALDSLSLTAIPAEDEALRGPVREFLAKALQGVPAHVRARSWSGYDGAFSRELGRRARAAQLPEGGVGRAVRTLRRGRGRRHGRTVPTVTGSAHRVPLQNGYLTHHLP